MKKVLELRFDPRADAVRDARHALDGLEGECGPELLDNIRLLVSELVTNCIRHGDPEARSWIGLEVGVSNSGIRVEVTDSGPGFDPAPVFPSIYQTSGWGLYLVEQLSDRWGVTLEDRTRVWFEVDADFLQPGNGRSIAF